MDKALLIRLLKNLLSVPVSDVSADDSALTDFEREYCFNSVLQPMYTEKALRFLINSAKQGVIYEIVDYIGVCLTFFLYEDISCILGPYVKKEYSETAMENILLKNFLPASLLLRLRLYYTSFAILPTMTIEETICRVLSSFENESISFEYKRLSGFIADTSDINQDESILSDTDYSEIYKRYDLENRFLTDVRLGDTDGVITSFRAMQKNVSLSGFSSDIREYYLSSTAFSLMIALTRKAAEQSGLSVITINKITQKYVQIFSSSRGRNRTGILADYLTELTKAVHRHKITYGSYTIPVQKAIEYITLHLTDSIRIKDISASAGLSVSQFSTLFKSETGETTTSYIARKRCKKAASLILDSTLRISEVSSFVGYSDNNYFVKVFKRVYGMTPSEYRKKNS